MKTAVSIPDPLFKEAEAAARKMGISRSKLVQTALEEFLAQRRDLAITEAINKAVERHGGLDREDELWLEHSARTVREALQDDE